MIEIYEDYGHKQLSNSIGRVVELDVYIPELHLGFEYQGEQHYKPTYWASDFENQKIRDKQKREMYTRVFFFLDDNIYLILC